MTTPTSTTSTSETSATSSSTTESSFTEVDAGCALPPPPDAGAEAGSVQWAAAFGLSGATDVGSLALDPTTGNVAIMGYFQGTTSFGGTDVTNSEGGVFLASFTPAGAYRWADTFSNISPANTVAVDGAGNVLLVGEFQGAANFGGGLVSSSPDGDTFFAKYSSAGAYVWLKHFPAAPSACCGTPVGAAFDPSGNIYVVGEPDGNALDLGCGPLPYGMKMFVAELTAAGDCVWSNGYGPVVDGGSNYTQSEQIVFDGTGNPLVAGGFYGTIDFGTGPFTAPGIGMDVFILSLNAAGSVLWAKSWGVGASVAQATGIGTDTCGDILIDGTFSDTLDFGCGTLTELGDTGAGDIFLAKLDASGSCIWSQSYGDPNEQLGGPLAVTDFGEPVITGGFSGVVNFGGGDLDGAPAGSSAVYIAAFGASGTFEWAYAGGPPASNSTNSIGLGLGAYGPSVLTTGTFQGGTLDLAGDEENAASQQDTYLANFVR